MACCKFSWVDVSLLYVNPLLNTGLFLLKAIGGLWYISGGGGLNFRCMLSDSSPEFHIYSSTQYWWCLLWIQTWTWDMCPLNSDSALLDFLQHWETLKVEFPLWFYICLSIPIFVWLYHFCWFMIHAWHTLVKNEAIFSAIFTVWKGTKLFLNCTRGFLQIRGYLFECWPNHGVNPFQYA